MPAPDSIGLNIVLPNEPAPNEYVTPELCFNFHYFAIRKMHFLMRARAICIFPGGFGTLDEMFESLTLIQTGRMRRVPFLLFGKSFWEKIINWDALAEAGTISADDLDLFRFVETAKRRWISSRPGRTRADGGAGHGFRRKIVSRWCPQFSARYRDDGDFASHRHPKPPVGYLDGVRVSCPSPRKAELIQAP